jgi:hypothetical protein
MARQEGSQRIIGRIGNLIYYKRKGVYLVRMASTPPSKKRMQEDPVFIKTRQLNREFGAAAKAGHDFRAALATIMDSVADSDITGRVQGLFSKVTYHGSGEAGSHSLEVLKHPGELRGFQFNKRSSFDSMFLGRIKVIEKLSRKQATLTISAFDPTKQIGAITGATHMRFSFTLLVFSDYIFNVTTKKYEVSNPSLNCKVVTVYSNAIPLDCMCEDVELTAKLPIKTKLPKSVGVIAMITLKFHKEEGSVMMNIGSKNCMKIENVF